MSFAAALLRWYDGHKRDLPWRRSASPWRTLVSELMLQQTVVATVVPYFERFVARFPDVAALAAASEDEVLALWAGLGYYARARNLHRAAQLIVLRHGGEVPGDIAALRALPGVGPYTAAAVASIAFGRSVFALDGNAARVMARFGAVTARIESPRTREKLRVLGQALMPRRRAGDFTEAVMELGATVCVPGVPGCHECPVRPTCRAHALGRQDRIPRPKVRARRRMLRIACALVERRGRILLVRAGEGQLFRGTWLLPWVEIAPGRDSAAAARGVLASNGLATASGKRVRQVEHTLTHREITADIVAIAARGRLKAPLAWVSRTDLGRVPLSTFARKTLGLASDEDSGG